MALAAKVSRNSQIFKQQTGFLGITYIQTNRYSDTKRNNLSYLKKGTGGRSSFNGIVATVFGNSGFIGRSVCNKLGKIGSQIILPYRSDPYEILRLKLVGDLGQVLFTPFDIRDEESIIKSIRYSNVVINLVGRDWETKNFKFDDVHVKGARTLARLSKQMGVQKFIHLSSLHAEEHPTPYIYKGGSKFFASKWAGEQAVLEEFPEATIFRPTDVYGPEDRFLRFYAGGARRQILYMPLWKKGEATIKQPVYVSDLAAGIIAACRDADAAGKIYQAVGPRRYYLSELVDWFFRIMERDEAWGYKRYDMRFDPTFFLKVAILERLSPGFPVGNMHHQRIERECASDKVDPKLPTLEDLGVFLTKMEDQVPWELRAYKYAAYHFKEDLNVVDKIAPPKFI